MVDLTRTDVYPGFVPDEDVETCLRVLRTLRAVYLRPESFGPYEALTLSEAHAVLHGAVAQCQEGDGGQDAGRPDQRAVETTDAAEREETTAEPDYTAYYDPDFAV